MYVRITYPGSSRGEKPPATGGGDTNLNHTGTQSGCVPVLLNSSRSFHAREDALMWVSYVPA
jgi:hypothetical protein